MIWTVARDPVYDWINFAQRTREDNSGLFLQVRWNRYEKPVALFHSATGVIPL